jgi:hypothetical protein
MTSGVNRVPADGYCDHLGWEPEAGKRRGGVSWIHLFSLPPTRDDGLANTKIGCYRFPAFWAYERYSLTGKWCGDNDAGHES